MVLAPSPKILTQGNRFLVLFVFTSAVTHFPADTMASACVQDGGQLDMENLHVDSDLASLMNSCLSTMVEALSESKGGREDGEGGITEGQEERNEGGNEARKRLSEVEGEGEEQSDGDDDTSACNDIFDEPWERETMMRVISQLTVMSSPPPSPSPSPISGPAHVGRFESQAPSWKKSLSLLSKAAFRALDGVWESFPRVLILLSRMPC